MDPHDPRRYTLRIIHGSKDSVDLDVVYVFPQLPSFEECRLFCSEDKVKRKSDSFERMKTEISFPFLKVSFLPVIKVSPMR